MSRAAGDLDLGFGLDGDRRPIAVVAHDAGGAELLSSWVRRSGLQARVRHALAGPALAIFERKLGAVASMPLAEAIAGAGLLIAGTGWQSTLELDALRTARESGVRSVAFLDHWVNQRERFTRGGREVLPDALWVGDEIALRLARERLPELPVRLVENPYFADLREALAACPPRVPPADGALAVLYVSEPIAAHAAQQLGEGRHPGYSEHEALAYALGHLHRLGSRIERVVVRPHPSEPEAKYAVILAGAAARGLPIDLGGSAPLIVEIAAADIVIGCNSMALVVGLLAGKRVVSAIPPAGPRCVLPQAGIEMLREL